MGLASAIAAHEVIKYKRRERLEEEEHGEQSQELAEAVHRLKRLTDQQDQDLVLLHGLMDSYGRALETICPEEGAAKPKQ